MPLRAEYPDYGMPDHRQHVPSVTLPTSGVHLASVNGSEATSFEVKSLGGKDYYICHRDTDTPVAKLYRNITNEELLAIKRTLDGKMPPNND